MSESAITALIFLLLGALCGSLGVMLVGANPLTRVGRATFAWRRERGRRASAMMRAGMEPGSALMRAQKDMEWEAQEVERVLDKVGSAGQTPDEPAPRRTRGFNYH